MDLITPDAGLLFWMTLIFGVVFFVLAKFGFPAVTSMVEKRNAHIAESLEQAKRTEERMAELSREQARIIEEARKEQASIIKDATKAGQAIIDDAKDKAREEADKMIAAAKAEIEARKESALRDIRTQVALLSVDIAEKVLRKELETPAGMDSLLDAMTRELPSAGGKNAVN